MEDKKKYKALILGITGQDGSYLAKKLIDEGFLVFGTTRFGYQLQWLHSVWAGRVMIKA